MKTDSTMRRSESTQVSDWEWKGNTGNHWKMKTPKSTAVPRRVAIDDTWQGSINNVPKPTYWTPDELDRKFERADKTPCPVQSPAFNAKRDDVEIQMLKTRMDRQEDLMGKMMQEIISLRRELKSNASKLTEPGGNRMKENLAQEGVDPGSSTLSGRRGTREEVPLAAMQVNQVRDYVESVRSFEAPEVQPKRISVESPGTKFVAEFSELFELDSGQHALLASIIDRSAFHKQRNRSRNSNI